MSVPAISDVFVDSVDGQKYPIIIDDSIDVARVKTRTNEFEIDIKEFLYGFKLTKKKILQACKLICEFAEAVGEFSIKDLLEEDARRGYGIFTYLWEKNQEKIKRWFKNNMGRNLMRSTSIADPSGHLIPAFRNKKKGSGIYTTEFSRLIEHQPEVQQYLELVVVEEEDADQPKGKGAKTGDTRNPAASYTRYASATGVPVKATSFTVEDSTVGIIRSLVRDAKHVLRRLADFEEEIPTEGIPISTTRMNKAVHALMSEIELVEEDIEAYISKSESYQENNQYWNDKLKEKATN